MLRTSPRVAERGLAVLCVAMAGALLVAGWQRTWFLTDDAFIAFRYVSNSALGHGYVWNPAPFRPVEGYSSFLWVVLLDITWRLTGAPPPAVANDLALVCGLLSLVVGARILMRWSWRAALQRWRLVLLGLFLLGVVTQRTFVTWTSSGFETALFNLLVLVWVALCLDARTPSPWRVMQVASLATLLHLTRPEGLLFAAATLAILAIWGWEKTRLRSLRFAAACTPLLGIAAHLGWRRAYYDAWLPNTYHAKVVGAWAESGVRYALSFVLEYALWFPFLVVLVVGLRTGAALVAARHKRNASADAPASGGAGGGDQDPAERRRQVRVATAALCLGALLGHFLFYTFVVGGDHFEYRVYSHLVLPGYLGLLWLGNRSQLRGATVALLLAVQVALALPVAWSHWALSQDLDTRAETKRMRVALAPHWPRPLRWYAAAFDDLQFWLIERWVCVRHQEHKVNQEYLASLYPSRAEGERLPATGFPVHAFQAVGVASWTLPHVNVIDRLGLNDYVVARLPVADGRLRGMAHEHRAPEDYVDCFAPNVFLKRGGGGVRIVARATPLTAADIVACERAWAARVR